MKKENSIAFIGAGRIAYSLVHALKKRGFNLPLILSRKKESAEALALRYHIPDYSDNISCLKEFSGTVFLSVPDKSLKALAKDISLLELNFGSIAFVHLSGAFDLSILKALSDKGSPTGSMHIMQSFPLLKKVSITDCYAAVESGNEMMKKYLFELAKTLRLKPFPIKGKEKISYHIAAVYASNFINALMYAASDLCKDVEKLPAISFDILEPIMKSVLANIKKTDAVNALSGPVERGDEDTIKKHIQLLSKKNKHLLNSYVSLSLLLLEAAEEKYKVQGDKPQINYEKIKKLLKKELSKK